MTEKRFTEEELNAAVAVERRRCMAIVQAARNGEIDGDLRCLISRMESGEPSLEPTLR